MTDSMPLSTNMQPVSLVEALRRLGQPENLKELRAKGWHDSATFIEACLPLLPPIALDSPPLSAKGKP